MKLKLNQARALSLMYAQSKQIEQAIQKLRSDLDAANADILETVRDYSGDTSITFTSHNVEFDQSNGELKIEAIQ